MKFEDLSFIVRPTLKGTLPLEMYRLLRISGMKEIFGESTKPVLYRLGKTLSTYFELKKEEELIELIKRLGIGIPKIYQKVEENVTIHLYECMTCAGLPYTGELFCDLECGFIAGGYEKILGCKTKGTQTKSWTTGSGYCEFIIELF